MSNLLVHLSTLKQTEKKKLTLTNTENINQFYKDQSFHLGIKSYPEKYYLCVTFFWLIQRCQCMKLFETKNMYSQYYYQLNKLAGISDLKHEISYNSYKNININYTI